MNIEEIEGRRLPPVPWEEGDNIPWSDLEFSERMLKEHLSQKHDLASRCFDKIDNHVDWIHHQLLAGKSTRILDLTCGPGLYTGRLARLGHTCTGIDYAPASIRYAKEEADREAISCTYTLADVREAVFGDGYGLVMMINGQFNVFRRQEARTIVQKALAALEPGGSFLLEPQSAGTVEKTGRSGTSWYSCGRDGGLFSERPHLCLKESFWHAEAGATTERFFIIDARTGEVARHVLTSEAYAEEEIREMLDAEGFKKVTSFPSLMGAKAEDESQTAYFVVVGRK